MPFPFTRNGAIEVPGLTPDLALERLRIALAESHVCDLRRDGDRLLFRGRLLKLVGSWNVLNSVASGEINASSMTDGVRIAYRVSFIELVLFASLLMALFAVLMSGKGRADLAWMVVGWSWLVGSNYLIASLLFPRFLRRAASRTQTS